MDFSIPELAKRIIDIADARGINVCQANQEEMRKVVKALLMEIKYDEGEQKEMLKKNWKGKLRTYMLIASGLATGAIVIAGSTQQAIAGGHN